MSEPYRRKNSSQRGILIAIIIALCVVLIASAAFLIYLLRQGEDSLPAESLKPSTGETTTIPTTSQVPPTSSVVTEPQIPQEVTALVQQADFIAAGYDYEKAISMLSESAYYSEYPLLSERVDAYREADSQLVTYKTPQDIPHVFFHSLIADTDRAFDGDGDAAGYNMNMTTIKEFNAILEQMYERGYVLISPYDMAHEVTDESGTHFTYGNIRLPEGKKPFLMSQDDLNYYSYMIGTVVDKVNDGKGAKPIFVDSENDGFAHKLVIGEDGYPTCEYMDAQGNITTGDYDLVPLLERFIQEHPDFSYHGARAILGVTGFEGVFGYRTKPSYEAAMGSGAYAKEVADAKALAQCLRDKGWIIASHSYGHLSYGSEWKDGQNQPVSAYRVEADSDRWENTVQPIVGDTDVLLFPYGADIHTWHKYPTDNEKFKALYEDGYRYFYNVDGNVWNQLGDNYFRGGRQNLDGYRMYHNPELLAELFDAESVFDSARPTPVPGGSRM